MPTIDLETIIDAPSDRVFDLARSIDAHQFSASSTGERAIAGVTSGLIKPGERVTWEGTHFGVRQRLTSEITAFDFPNHFQDVMVAGAFKSLRHDHYFESYDGGTKMTDKFCFEAPFGLIGRIAEILILESYMRRFLIGRNAKLKDLAESDGWRKYLDFPMR